MKSEIQHTKYKAEPIVLGGTVFVTVLLRTLALFFDRKENGYFDQKIMTGISVGILLAFTLFASLIGVRHRFERRRPADAHSPLLYLPSAFAALTVILFLYRFYPQLASFRTSKILYGASVLAVVSGAIAVIYLFLRVFIEAPLSSFRALTGLGASLFSGLLAIYLYFETTLPLNEPSKLADQVAFLTCALFFLAESRASLDRDKAWLRTSVTMIAAAYSAYASLPILIYRAIAGECLSVDIHCALVLLGCFALTTGSLLLSGSRRPHSLHPYIQALTESFGERERQIAAEQDERNEEKQENQESDALAEDQIAMENLVPIDGVHTDGLQAEEQS